ncbi:MAG: RluA family pseudouridine synthase [Bacillota bacterium]
MTRILEYTVQETKVKAEIFLKAQGFSTRLITELKYLEEGITRNGQKIFTNEFLYKDEVIRIALPIGETSEGIVPTELPFPIVYEDEDIVVVDKPSGMAIHPSQGNFLSTLANAALFHYQQKGIPFVFRAINRLDKDTSGLLVLAKHSLSACILSEDMKNRAIHRTYLAIVLGETEQHGTIDAPIARVADSTIERCVDFSRGARAVTHYDTVYQEKVGDDTYSLVSAKLETGRTHQIRVHFSYINRPLLGDFLYNPNFEKIKRQALHSHILQFVHPISKEMMVFSSNLPQDMLSCFVNCCKFV